MTIAAALLVASFFIGVSAVLPVVGFYFIALLVAAAQILDSRLEKRSRGQPPKRPAQRGQALEVSAMAGSAILSPKSAEMSVPVACLIIELSSASGGH